MANSGYAIFLIILGWLALAVAVGAVGAALMHAYPAWFGLVLAGQIALGGFIGWHVPNALRAVR